MRSHGLEGNNDDGLEASDAHRRCHLACEPAAAPLPTCGTRTTSRIGAASGSLVGPRSRGSSSRGPCCAEPGNTDSGRHQLDRRGEHPRRCPRSPPRRSPQSRRAGTTGAAFRAGVPQVVVSVGTDQPFWAHRVAHLGAGPRPFPRKRLTADRLAAAISRAVGDEGIQARAREVGWRVRAEDGATRAVEVIERALGAARHERRASPPRSVVAARQRSSQVARASPPSRVGSTRGARPAPRGPATSRRVRTLADGEKMRPETAVPATLGRVHGASLARRTAGTELGGR